MAQLRQDYAHFAAQDAVIVVVGPENAAAFERFWRKENFPFIGLPDPQHQVANLYGQQVKLLKLGRLPAVILIDKSGQIRYRHYGESMRDIPPNSELLTLLAELNQEKIAQR